MNTMKRSIETRSLTRPAAVIAVLAVALSGALLSPGDSVGAEHVFGAVLLGRQEVPPNASTAFGGGQFLIDTDANTMSYRIAFTGLTGAETGAHIHGFAPPGANGGALHNLPLGNRKLGVWNFGAANEDDVFAGLTYVNIHSAGFPGGEIRGQLRGFVNPAVGGHRPTQFEPGGGLVASRIPALDPDGSLRPAMSALRRGAQVNRRGARALAG